MISRGLTWSENIINTGVFLLVLLWAYTASVKLGDYHRFEQQMRIQNLYPWMIPLVTVALPWAELLLAILLLFPVTRLAGLYLSLIAMIAFTGYVAAAAFHVFSHVPCACGGVFERIGWHLHLVLNVLFLFICLITIRLTNKRKGVV